MEAKKEKKVVIGTVASEEETPSFEKVRIKLKAEKEVKPGDLIRIPTDRAGKESILIGRIRSAFEHNPNEVPADINARDSLGLPSSYPDESESTTIFRVAIADLVEEITEATDNEGEKNIEMNAPQTLPVSGTPVYRASEEEVTRVLGLEEDSDDDESPNEGLTIGESAGGQKIPVSLKRQSIQRHLFVCGTTGSGKSYAMGVFTEELLKQGLPVVFIDTQNEYSKLVDKLGGKVLTPGEDFTIRISSLTANELVEAIPVVSNSTVQTNIVTKAFVELKKELSSGDRSKFTVDDLLRRIREVGPSVTNKNDSIDLAHRRTKSIQRNPLFGDFEAKDRADWRSLLIPCLDLNCKSLTTSDLRLLATALLRELQDLRKRTDKNGKPWIPPYLAVIDEAHLFAPQGESSSCKQIIREGVRIGRHHGIAMALLTQSPIDIDKSIIRQCNTRLVFALEPDQLDAIRGVKADATEEMLDALPKMPQGRCLLSGTYETIKHTVPVQIRERETKDSEGGETPDVFAEMQEKWLNQYGRG